MQHVPPERPVAAGPFVIDVDGEPQGIVIRDGDRFRFVAVRLPAFAIDGQHFASIEDARMAARAALDDEIPD
jgi:hypothetical protein